MAVYMYNINVPWAILSGSLGATRRNMAEVPADRRRQQRLQLDYFRKSECAF